MRASGTALATALALGGCGLAPSAPAPMAPAGAAVVRFAPETDTPALRDALAARSGVAPSAREALFAHAEIWADASAARVAEVLAPELGKSVSTVAAPVRYALGPGPLASAELPAPAFRLQAIYNDPDYAKQWHLQAAKIPPVWGRSTGRGVTVAVIDSGADPEHPDLKGNLLPLVDEVVATGKQDVSRGLSFDGKDGHGHGTHVAGILGAIGNNGRGVVGVAPDVKILPIKVATGEGYADDTVIAKGIADAIAAGADVINLSIGGTEPSALLQDGLSAAFEADIPLVIAAGNDGGALNYPAAYGGSISVGAVTDTGKVASYSSHGPKLLMVAPGGGQPGRSEGAAIYSTTPTYPCPLNGFASGGAPYGNLAGTSMAAPVVAGAIALLKSAEPGLSVSQVRTRLAAACKPGPDGVDEFFGFGALDAERAITGPLAAYAGKAP